MIFSELLYAAKNGDAFATEVLLKMYHPLLYKESMIEGAYDEDLYQELCIKFIYCIEKFNIQET